MIISRKRAFITNYCPTSGLRSLTRALQLKQPCRRLFPRRYHLLPLGEDCWAHHHQHHQPFAIVVGDNGRAPGSSSMMQFTVSLAMQIALFQHFAMITVFSYLVRRSPSISPLGVQMSNRGIVTRGVVSNTPGGFGIKTWIHNQHWIFWTITQSDFDDQYVIVSGGGGHYQSSRASDYGGDSSVKGGGGGGTEMRI